MCFEKKNKYGEDTHPHFHFNFETYASKEAIQSWVRRYPTFTIKGNKMYSLTRHAEPDDYERWYRYCCKERVLRKGHTAGFSDVEIERMILLAKDERARAVAYNQKKKEARNKKDTLFHRYSQIITKSKVDTDYKSIWIAFLQCYKDEDRAVNPQTIRGYTYLYQLKEHVITDEEFFYIQNPLEKT